MGRITAIDVFKPMNSTVDATFVTNDELMGRLIDGEPMIQPSSVIKVPVRLDPSPTARLEYIKFIAAFWNLEAMAETIFTAGVNQYECIANQVRPLTWVPKIHPSYQLVLSHLLHRSSRQCRKGPSLLGSAAKTSETTTGSLPP